MIPSGKGQKELRDKHAIFFPGQWILACPQSTSQDDWLLTIRITVRWTGLQSPLRLWSNEGFCVRPQLWSPPVPCSSHDLVKEDPPFSLSLWLNNRAGLVPDEEEGLEASWGWGWETLDKKEIPSCLLFALFLFCQADTESSESKETQLRKWRTGKPVRHFLYWLLMWEGPAHSGWCHTWAGDPKLNKKTNGESQ